MIAATQRIMRTLMIAFLSLLARFTALMALALVPSAAFAQGADPAGSGPINSALLWLQGTLLVRWPPPLR